MQTSSSDRNEKGRGSLATPATSLEPKQEVTNMKNNNTLSILNHAVVTMSSREIAELTGKTHSNVMRDIRAMMTNLKEDSNLNPLCKTTRYIGSNGIEYDQYELDKDTCLTLLLGYDAIARMRVIKRWQELEAQVALPQIPNFSDPVAAARAWADEVEAKRLIADERDEAIRTKAFISRKREASALGKLSGATRKISKLERALGDATDYKQAKAIPWLADYFNLSSTAYSQIGKVLTKVSKELGIETIEIEDTRFGKVRAYHVDVIAEFRDRLDSNPDLLAKYRGGEAA